MHNPDSDLPPLGASVRLTRDVIYLGETIAGGDRGRVAYTTDGNGRPFYGVSLDDPPPAIGDDGTVWFACRERFLSFIEPVELGRGRDE